MSTELKFDYDACDAPYILCSLVALYKEWACPGGILDADDSPKGLLIESYGGELEIMSELWILTIQTATAICEVIDFNKADGKLGVFCYEQCDRHDEDSLVWAVWQLIPDGRGITHKAVVEIVRAYALAHGWPTNA